MHRRAFLAGVHEAGAPQHCELLGEVGRLDPDERLHRADGALTVGEDLQHADPGGMSQGPEELSLGLGNGTAQRSFQRPIRHVANLAYLNN